MSAISLKMYTRRSARYHFMEWMIPQVSGLRWHGRRTLCPARPATSELDESDAVRGNPLSANAKKLESETNKIRMVLMLSISILCGQFGWALICQVIIKKVSDFLFLRLHLSFDRGKVFQAKYTEILLQFVIISNDHYDLNGASRFVSIPLSYKGMPPLSLPFRPSLYLMSATLFKDYSFSIRYIVKKRRLFSILLNISPNSYLPFCPHTLPCYVQKQ